MKQTITMEKTMKRLILMLLVIGTAIILFGCSVVFLAVMATLTIMRMYGEYKERKEDKQVKRVL